jgi:hypothetical protein
MHFTDRFVILFYQTLLLFLHLAYIDMFIELYKHNSITSDFMQVFAFSEVIYLIGNYLIYRAEKDNK